MTKGEKIKKTCMERYGVENISQLNSIKQKKEETCMKNYGVSNPSFSKKILIKIGDTLEQNYGVRHALQDKNTLEKAQNTMEKKYGVKNALKNDELLEKSKQTCFKNNGSHFPMQSDIIKQNTKETRIKNGLQIPDALLSDWALYKKKVIYETRKFKKQLLEQWDGNDFYDGEYIKNNFTLFKCRSKEYPSIDHKISIYYGFMNKISEKIIGNINNLCVTKTEINISKGELCSEHYKCK